ncbi:dTDP-4-dehydrorhamnose reductase [uncultured Christiangramia sp.]|uniref:dTDP-4-dehydrorhamnose reductase n=1 Tax=uncultured Christiangramia sp. TaxID=503836 RepID=UPI0026229E73|nr:dTDP-4-dehydrorhamnose reductase [uncultured Christiangramia sp.]
MKNILVTGANGQLGSCFRKHKKKFPDFNFDFKSSAELDISNFAEVERLFSSRSYDFCINAAAYTNVEKAESEKEKAFQINAEAPGKLAEVCAANQVKIIHFSTDYVFDGSKTEPYLETDEVNPINIYGASKLAGERQIAEVIDEHLIFRTSWLYSEFGHNFFCTILKKAAERASLNITTTQLGTPTNANDLAKYVLDGIQKDSSETGIYHFSNLGQASWYDFAEEILNYSGKIDQVVLNKTGFFKTLAQRPEYSVLSKEKAIQEFGEIRDWRNSLRDLIDEVV